jgi:uncharacterized protein YicC (UPF0701 family)
MESRFGFAINFSSLTVDKAEKLSETIAANLDKIRHSVALHTAETNPRYMELLTVQEGLTTWLEENRTTLTEGEVGNAEVLLAAKDMVDSVQDAIEKVGKMQNEQLPQLLDSIRDQIGSEQSEAFKSAVGETLSTLMQNLQAAREGVDNGVRVLSGEQVDQPMAMPGDQPADMGGELPPPPPASDLDADETDAFGATDAAVGGTEELGREKR